uniref:F-box domain-containing protein n=1 Tax=Trichogramma kaykai TaxID=54128 RepID=A0ABD2VWD1_9HYME
MSLSSVKKLKKLQERFGSKIEQKRREFVRQALIIFRYWTGPLPNLRDMFRPEVIDRLITETITHGAVSNYENYPGDRFIELVIRTGYRDEPDVDKDGKPLLSRTTALHSARKFYISTYENKMLVRQLFKIYDRFDVNYTDKCGVTHFHVACEAGCKDVIKKFLDRGQDPNLIAKTTGESPLHFAMRRRRTKAMKVLLKAGADPSLADAEGSTPLHAICFGDIYDEMMKLFFRITAEMQLPVQVDARNHEGKTPLHMAIERQHRNVMEILLRNKANPNLSNKNGSTYLHLISMGRNSGAADLAKFFFEINDEVDQRVLVDAQDKWGRTPLYWALWRVNKRLTELLLRRGANPNLANEEGWTPLHVISRGNRDTCWLKMLFELGGQEHESVRVDARDNQGRTPLHLALLNDNSRVAASLLRRGANPNLANDAGETCLHFVSQGHHDNHKLMNTLLNSRKFKPWQINARDEKGRTPLQLAAARFLPNIVDALLHGEADLSEFVFPTESYTIDDVFVSENWQLKLRMVFGVLPCVECLEKRGYELDRKSAFAIMKNLDNFGLLEKSALREKRLLDDKKLEKAMSKINMKTNLTFYELTRLGPKEAAKQFTYTDCLDFLRRNRKCSLHEEYAEACLARVSERLLRGFYRTWALEPFLELIHYRMPVECCEMIFEQLHNEDLYNICVTANKSRKDEKKRKKRDNESPVKTEKAKKRGKIEES